MMMSFFRNVSDTSGGELIFGGIDSSKYSGSITYIPVAVEGYWEFQLTRYKVFTFHSFDQLFFDSIQVGSTTISQSTYAIVDTGTTLIVGPAASVVALHAVVGAFYDSSSNQFTVNCFARPLSSFPNVIFAVGNAEFILAPEHYLLMIGNQSSDAACATIFSIGDQKDLRGNEFWILGDYFLYRYYSIFDITNNRIGLAQSISYDYVSSASYIQSCFLLLIFLFFLANV